MKIKSNPVRFKTGAEAGLAEGEFLVYPSTFTRTPDSYGDVVAKGAFAKGIAARKEGGIVLPGLYGHRLDDPDFYVASAIEEGEDEHGWWVKGSFDLESPKGAQVYRLVKSGRLRELSFAYDVLDAQWIKLPDGTEAYELKDLDVFEFSFVPVGANRDTSVVAVKSAVDALVDGVKAGRVLSAKNEETLRGAVAALDAALSSIKSVLPGTSDAGNDQGADAPPRANDEEPSGAKSEEPAATSSAADAWQRSINAKAFDANGLRLIPKEGNE
ncbi:HK97 family phage prohead protease [Microbacterium caowuchunii]|uniref:HK97 family phage prohead protease n=1 Tax=Microbacterium caowuchunii TaxID=2614638 RepID=A0A5N0TH04_9MICO|nr:HK97 family phage prohead protease [Microbacterium caowuchunii]KAA9133754.1 HK97 family phage prohead protease [Microbacterium caowuchunii]